MTIGSPDFQGYAQWAATPTNPLAVTVPVAGANSATFTTSNFGAVHLLLSADAQGCSVQVNFYNDPGLSILTGTYQWFFNDTCELDVVVPIRGPFMQLAYSNTSGSTRTVLQTVQQLNPNVSRPVFTGNLNLIATGFVTAPISSTTSYPLPFVMPGPATWWFEPADATGKLTFIIIPAVGTMFSSQIPFEKVGLVAEADGTIYLPDLPMTVQVKNLDAAATHSYRATLIACGQ